MRSLLVVVDVLELQQVGEAAHGPVSGAASAVVHVLDQSSKVQFVAIQVKVFFFLAFGYWACSSHTALLFSYLYICMYL